MYTYTGLVKNVKDGDTIVIDIDLGFGVILTDQTIRLSKINAPELKSEALGLQSKDRLVSLILGKTVKIITEKDKKEKFGRWLGTILLFDGKKDININDLMVSEGLALNYGTKK